MVSGRAGMRMRIGGVLAKRRYDLTGSPAPEAPVSSAAGAAGGGEQHSIRQAPIKEPQQLPGLCCWGVKQQASGWAATSA